MSGAFGGYCYSDKPAPKCVCGNLLEKTDLIRGIYRCPTCVEWEKITTLRDTVRKCRSCGHPYIPLRISNGCCSERCLMSVALREYHSERAQRWFREGWGWLALDILQQVWQEIYPAPLISTEQPAPMAQWNVFYNVDARKPARKTSKLSQLPPRHDNVSNAQTHIENCVAVFEDLVECAWDRRDEMCGVRS